MTTKRSYGDLCGIARALDVVGERWALLVVRELTLGPKRFTDLRAGLPQVGPDVLAQRLRELEQSGVVQRRTLAPPAGSRVYELTERGRALEPVLIELGRWGTFAPVPPGDPRLGVDSTMIALKTLFDGEAAGGMEATYELRLGDQTFRAAVGDGRLELERGEAPSPVAVIASDPGTLAEVLWQGRPLADAQRSGDARVEGDRRAAARFLKLFPLPVS
ncbi:MAG: winged helix-turn-helix transcriptional regulator [Candidatus Limnocylindria bacterium]